MFIADKLSNKKTNNNGNEAFRRQEEGGEKEEGDGALSPFPPSSATVFLALFFLLLAFDLFPPSFAKLLLDVAAVCRFAFDGKGADDGKSDRTAAAALAVGCCCSGADDANMDTAGDIVFLLLVN